MNYKKLYISAFIEGGLVMLLEIATPIIIAPVLGGSLTIWSIIISVSVAALSIGYFLGGSIFSKKDDTKKLLALRNLFLLNSLLILIGWLLYAYQNYFKFSGPYQIYSWVLVVIILFFPLIIFGTTTPLIIQLVSRNKNVTSVGNVYSLSTIGGIVFCLITGFFLIPELGVSKTILLACLFTLLIPFTLLSSVKSNWLNLYSYSYIAGIIFLIASTSIFSNNKNFEDVNILHHSEGINGQLMVMDINYPNGIEERILLMNRIGQTWINKNTGYSIWGYNGAMISLASIYPKKSKVLLLGLGGGIVAKNLININEQSIDAVELDKRVTDISKEFFELNNYSNSIRFFNDDARRYVKKCKTKYDLIILDVFKEASPSHALSKENFDDIKKIMNPNGMIIINFNGFLEGDKGQGNRALNQTIMAAGFKSKIFSTQEVGESNRNFLHTAFIEEPNWKNQRYISYYNNEPYYLKNHLIDINKHTDKKTIITDNKPVMDQLNRHAIAEWRRVYFLNFTKRFKDQQNIPLSK